MQNLVILEENLDKNYQPTRQEILEYAIFLGMSPRSDERFFYIAEEGLKTPLQHPWQPGQNQNGEIFYINIQTQEISEENPLDTIFRLDINIIRQKFIDAKMKDNNQQVPKNKAAGKLQNMIQAYRELDKKRKYDESKQLKINQKQIKEQFKEEQNENNNNLIKQGQNQDQQDEQEQNQESNEINQDQIQNLKIE